MAERRGKPTGEIRQMALYQHGYGIGYVDSFFKTVWRYISPADRKKYQFTPDECRFRGVTNSVYIVAGDGNVRTWITSAQRRAPTCPECGYKYDLSKPARYNRA